MGVLRAVGKIYFGVAGVAARAEGEADSQRGNDRKTRARAKAKALSANGLPRSDGSGVISMNENRRPARLCDCIGVDEGFVRDNNLALLWRQGSSAGSPADGGCGGS